MAASFNRKLFERIFSDAHVIDVDFSRWDKLIGLCVVADHVEAPTPSRLPVFLVEFQGVRRFSMKLNHLGVQLDKPEHHFQWLVDDFKVDATGPTLTVSLFGAKTWPRLEVECGDISIRQVPHSMLDELFPGWNAPGYPPLARPGIEGSYGLPRRGLRGHLK